MSEDQSDGLRFKRKNEWRKDAEPISSDALADAIVFGGGIDYSYSKIQNLESQMLSLISIVNTLISQMPQDKINEIADRHGYELCDKTL